MSAHPLFSDEDAALLLAQEAFRRFLHAAIQAAGILGHHAPSGGQNGRDLGFLEGRRALGFALIALAHRGQEPDLRARDPEGLATLSAALAAALAAKDACLERPRSRTRYDELPDGHADGSIDRPGARTGAANQRT